MTVLRVMVYVETTNHRALVHIGHIVDNPGDASDLGTDLCDELADDNPQVLAVIDR